MYVRMYVEYMPPAPPPFNLNFSFGHDQLGFLVGSRLAPPVLFRGAPPPPTVTRLFFEVSRLGTTFPFKTLAPSTDCSPCPHLTPPHPTPPHSTPPSRLPRNPFPFSQSSIPFCLQSRVIRLPTQVHAFLSSIRKYTHELTVDGKLPTDEELGDKLGATVQKIQVRGAGRCCPSCILLYAQRRTFFSSSVATSTGRFPYPIPLEGNPLSYKGMYTLRYEALLWEAFQQ